ncbi:MAG TPA: AsmA family protein [Reyranella sp.]
MSVRRRIGWAAAAIFGPLAVAAVALPYLVDVESYKPSLIQAVKDATGRELVIDGPMKLSVFPVPRISAQQVHFANAVGATGAQMIDVRWIGASPSWLALLQGRVEVGTVTLYQPIIVLETDADGVPNWQFKPGAGAAQPQGAPAVGFHLAVGELRIVQGTISYTNPQTGQTLKAEQVAATASVGSLNGPFSISGGATVNGVPLSLDFNLSEPKAAGHETTFSLTVLSGKLDFKGTVSEVSANAEVKGHLTVSTGALTDFIAAVVRASGQAQPKFDSAVVGNFTFDGGVEYTPTRLAVTDFKMSMGGETATGTLALEEGKAPSLTGHVALAKIDIETWLALLAVPGAFQTATPPTPVPAATSANQPAKPAPAAQAANPAPAAPAAKPIPAAQAAKPTTPAKSNSLSPFPTEMDVSLSLAITEALYRKGTVRDLALSLEIHKGVITVPQLKAVLPGDMVVQANAAAPAAPAVPAKPATPPAAPATGAVQASGEFSLTGPKLRDTLAWLGIDTSGVPAGKLQKLDLKGKLASTASGLQIAGLTVDLDGQQATGSGGVTFAMPLVATTTLQLDRFDLDAYMPPEQPAAPIAPTADAAKAVTATPTSAAPATLVPPAPPLPDKTVPIFGLKTKVAKLVFRKETLSGVEGDVSVQGNLLKLNTVKVADLLGARLDVHGSVTDFGTAPRYDLTFNATMPDADKVIDYAGLPKFINGKIGPASAGGGVVGTMDVIALRNATATLLGGTMRATGTLALGQNFHFDFSNFALETQDASRLLAVATGRAQGGTGAITAVGAFKGDEQHVIFDGNLTAVGTAMTGHIDAILGKRPNITANLRIPGTLDFDHWLGVSAGPAPAAPVQAAAAAAPEAAAASAPVAIPVPVGPPRAATGKSIDLSALRAFDATLTLETSAVAVASLKVTYADLQASLKNGVFTIAKLTGQFYGGAVDFNGTIDATKDALALDLRGSLQGIYLGEMLRGTAGTNSFGNQTLMISIDGKLNVMNIELKGSGTSPEQIRNSLSGTGEVSGYLYPSVTGGSLGLASFATGVGSLFSTEMGLASATLAGFINRQSPVTGQLLLAGNTVTLQNHTVQGQNAVALITSQNSMATATTDTTISLDTGKRGPADYVMTVKGPISSPTMSTRGGSN